MTLDELHALLAATPRPAPRRPRAAPDGPQRVIGYIRVSTEDQAESGAGLAAQRTAIEAAAERRGWPVTEWVEDTCSGAVPVEERPGLSAALDTLRRGRADVLMAARVDRVSRSLLDFPRLLDQARREGWEIAALDLGVDTSTAAGEMMAHILATFAHYERRLIGERTKAGMAERRALGVWTGRRSDVDPAVRERIVRERAEGKTLWQITNGLNDDGIRTAAGARWYPTSVRRAIRTAFREAAFAANIRGDDG